MAPSVSSNPDAVVGALRRGACASVAAAALWACATEPESAADAGAGVDVVDEGLPPLTCASLVQALTDGERCDPVRPMCGPAAACVRPMPDELPVCAQRCVPGACDAVCGLSRVCVAMNDALGRPVELDLNLDGAPETQGGACIEPAAELATAFGACAGPRGRECAAGLACAAFTEGATVGTCLPACETECSLYEGYLPTCFGLGEGQPSRCLISCSSTLFSDDCPAGLRCQTAMSGLALCLQ